MKKKSKVKQQGIHLYKNSKSWWWVLISRNGRTLATSEMYATKQAASKGIKSVAKFFDNNQHYYDHSQDEFNLVIF